MNLKYFSVLTALWVASSPASVDAQPNPLTVLGLPLGAPLDRPIDECQKAARPGIERTDYCSRFYPIADRKSGDYSLLPPRPESASFAVPPWLRAVSVELDDSGVVSRILATTSGPSTQRDIIGAITDRFGPATRSTDREAQNAYGSKWSVTSAFWELPNVHIAHNCSRINECYVLFDTPARAARSAKELEERKSRNKL